MQAARVLGDRAVPGYRKRQEQRVQPRVVEALADQSPGRKQKPRLILRDGRETRRHGGHLVLGHPAAKNDQMRDAGRKPLGQIIEVLVAFGQHERRPSFANGLEHVIADELIARLIRDQLRVKLLKLNSHVVGQGSERPKPGRDGHARHA